MMWWLIRLQKIESRNRCVAVMMNKILTIIDIINKRHTVNKVSKNSEGTIEKMICFIFGERRRMVKDNHVSTDPHEFEYLLFEVKVWFVSSGISRVLLIAEKWDTKNNNWCFNAVAAPKNDVARRIKAHERNHARVLFALPAVPTNDVCFLFFI